MNKKYFNVTLLVEYESSSERDAKQSAYEGMKSIFKRYYYVTISRKVIVLSDEVVECDKDGNTL